MLYIIISNIGFAAITLILYFRYSHFRISTALKIRELKKKLEESDARHEELASKLTQDFKSENDQVKKLLRDLENFRKEKEEEMRLRLEAEKQIDVAMQQIEDIQKRMNDWKKIQDSTISDARDTIKKVGDNIFEKLISSKKDEALNTKNAIDESIKTSMKNIYEYLENISRDVDEFKKKNFAQGPTVVAENGGNYSTNQQQNTTAESKTTAASPTIDESTKFILNDIKSLFRDSGFKAEKDYFLMENIKAPEHSKSMLCDMIFVRDQIACFIDFKANRYLSEYEKSPNKDTAVEILKQKLDKYLAYISNPKYTAILQKLSTDLGLTFTKSHVILAVDNREKTAILKGIGYFNKALELKLEVLDGDGVKDLAL